VPAGGRALDRARQLREQGHRGHDGGERRLLRPDVISLVQRIESAGDTHLPDRVVSNLTQTVSRGRQVYEWARQCEVPIAFGTDLWGPEAQKSQLREFEMRAGLDSAARIIRSATATNAELLMQKGKLGVVAPGADADLLVVDGDPLTDLRVMIDPQRNLKVIMKDGVIYKNELD
jgi:imidazolonepropionase-like amidohydrolase